MIDLYYFLAALTEEKLCKYTQCEDHVDFKLVDSLNIVFNKDKDSIVIAFPKIIAPWFAQIENVTITSSYFRFQIPGFEVPAYIYVPAKKTIELFRKHGFSAKKCKISSYHFKENSAIIAPSNKVVDLNIKYDMV